MTNIPVAYPSSSAAPSELERRTVAKVLWRIIPLMCFLYVLNYLDRVNVSHAKLKMPATLDWFNESVFAFGGSIFFLGYFLFEVPSNLIMQIVGARRWMARIMVSWGVISAAMAFVTQPWHFYGLRFLLGFAEAGFFPGMLLYINYWVPAEHRARAIALFMTSTALSGVVGGLLADRLLPLTGFGLVGWQWMFLLEGIPSVLCGVAIFFLLSDRPEQARWLSAAEKEVLAAKLASDQNGMAEGTAHRFLDAVVDVRVWVLCLLYATLMFGFYVINFWTPSLVESVVPAELKSHIGLLTAIPFFTAAVVMSIVGIWADRLGRRRHTVIMFAIVGASGFALAAKSSGPVAMVVALSLAAGGVWSTLGPFWSLPSRFLKGTAAAAGIGLINSVGNLLGGYIGLDIIARLKESSGGYGSGLWVACAIAGLAALLAVMIGRLGMRDTPIGISHRPSDGS